MEHFAMSFQPARAIQDLLVFGEYGDVNPSITDSSTYTFLSPDTMSAVFEHEIEGCFLYSRHWNPTNLALANALAALEGSEAAQVTASGMAAISATLLQLCRSGDEIISGRTIYGGTYALLKNFLPRYGITTRFVNICCDIAAVEAAITPRTRVLYTETISNPLLEVANIPALARLANAHNLTLVVDNTFSPFIIAPLQLGAHVVVHSLTKFINGMSDCVAGAICAPKSFVQELTDVNSGATMLLGPVLDSLRSAGILKNLHTLHLRMRQHSENARYLVDQLVAAGVRVYYPGLPDHPQHDLMCQLMQPGYGFGGMLTIDAGSLEQANRLMVRMQMAKIGYLAVSLGFYRTLFSSPGHSTSSEIPEEERQAMGLSDGLVRISVGLDHDIATTWQRMAACLEER
jgi:methionine-gamma-lyase